MGKRIFLNEINSCFNWSIVELEIEVEVEVEVEVDV
jgi:hypothetical protein